jgi:hypothetical protein
MQENIDIVTVKERIQLLKRMYQRYRINTEETFMEKMNAWKVKAYLAVRVDGKWDVTTGTSIRTVDENDEFGRHALEWAETKAIGRAIAARGIGIEGSYASKDEIEDSEHEAMAKLDITSPTVFGEKEAIEKDGKMEKVTADIKEEVAKNNIDDGTPHLYTREELAEITTQKALVAICEIVKADLSVIKGRRSQKQLREAIITSQNKDVKAVLDEQFPAEKKEKTSPTPKATSDNSLEEKFKKEMASKGIDTIAVSDDKPAVKTEAIKEGDDQEIPFKEVGGTLAENFDNTGNRFGVDIPELPESGERDYNSVVAVIYNELIVKGTVKMAKLEDAVDALGFRSKYKAFGHMLSNATKEEVNAVLNKI